MWKLNVLGKPILVTFVLFVLTSSVILPESIPQIDANRLSANTELLVDKEAIKLYKAQQQALKEALDSYFQKAIASGAIVGAGVSIVNGDSIVISDGFGKRHVKFNDVIDGETVFRLGSLSKGFAGILAANLKREGQLDWSDKVNNFIPQFKMGDNYNTNNITLATILSHTSGAPYHSYTNLIEAGVPLTEIASRFKLVKPLSKPGSVYSYQNALFALSADMMQQATGQDFNTLLNTKFFEPLGMQQTSMDHNTLLQNNNVAMPHSKKPYGWAPLKLNDHYYNAVAAGGINASALDMAKWMRLLLGRHPEIMDKEALQDAFNPYVDLKGQSKYYQRWNGHVSSHYGFGWRIHKFVDTHTKAQKTILHHGGSVNSYRNEIAVFPDDDLGICVLLNSNSKLASTVIPDLYEIVNKVYNEVNSKMASNTNKLASTNLE